MVQRLSEIEKWLIKTQNARTFQEFTGALLESIPELQELLAGRTPGDEDLTIGGADRDSPMAQIWASISSATTPPLETSWVRVYCILYRDVSTDTHPGADSVRAVEILLSRTIL